MRCYVAGWPEAPGACPKRLVAGFAAQLVSLAIDPVKQLFDIGMTDRAVLAVTHQILLADIGGVVAVGIFREKMVKRLFLVRAHFGRNRLIPFVGIVELRIDIDHHTAKRIEAVPDDLADAEFGWLWVIKYGVGCSGGTQPSQRR